MPRLTLMQRKASFWAGRLVIMLSGLAMGWLILEILIRVAYPIFPYTIRAALREVHRTPFTDERILPQQIWQADQEYQFVSRANVNNELQFPDPRVGFHVTTKNWLDPDSHVGFRVPSPAWEPTWPVDAVVVGDSFAFCYTEYDECWVQRLAAVHGMSVVNLGQVATGSISHLNLLNKFGLLYEPDLVIWQWYGNDFNDDYGMTQRATQPQRAAGMAQDIEKGVEQTSAFTRWLEINSAAYWIYRTATISEASSYKYQQFVDPYQVTLAGQQQFFGRPYTLQAFDLDNPKNQLGQQLSEESILKALPTLDSQGISLVILLIPSKEEVYQTWTEATLGREQLEKLAQGRRQMGDFCQESGLLCLDMIGPLTSAAAQEQHVYWPQDTHLNGLGNQLLADALWEFLIFHELIKPSDS